MSCKIKTKKHNDVPIVKIVGDLTLSAIRSLTQKLESLLKGSSAVIVIDLSETNYVDSHGLGAFVYTWKMLKQEKRELVFLNPQGFIREMLEQSNLHTIIRIVSDVEQI